MNPELRFVFDTNVLVSAFLFRNTAPRRALDLAVSSGYIVHSDETLEELWTVLVRPKFDRYVAMNDRIALLQGLEKISVRQLATQTITICRDPKDDKFLSLAVSCEAACIVTGDPDLLILADTFPILILSPADFLVRFSAG